MKHFFPVVLLAACVDTPPLYEPTVEQDRVAILMQPESPKAMTDLLIVVDDTIAMSAYRDRLATLPARLAARIESYTARWVDLRIAVTSNDGKLRRLPGMTEPWLADAYTFDYVRHRNYEGTLAAALTTLMDVGSGRGGTSTPLEAARHALETGSELVRDEGSGIGILSISARDDESPLPISEYIRWIRALSEGSRWRREVMNSGIYAQPAVRLDEYYKHVPWGIVTSIDSDNFEAAIPWVPTSPTWGGVTCLEVADLDPATPELDVDCAMMAEVNGAWRAVPRCTVEHIEAIERDNIDSRPRDACWWVRQNRQDCFYGSGYDLQLSGYTNAQHPAYRLDCRVTE